MSYRAGLPVGAGVIQREVVFHLTHDPLIGVHSDGPAPVTFGPPAFRRRFTTGVRRIQGGVIDRVRIGRRAGV